MSLTTHKPILLILLVCIVIIIIVSSGKLSILISPETEDTQSPQEKISAAVSAGDSFSTLWQEYDTAFHEMNAGLFKQWFEQWKSNLLGEHVSWILRYRGMQHPANGNEQETSGHISLYFRPLDEQLQTRSRIIGLALPDNTAALNLRLDDEVMVEGTIAGIAGEEQTLNVDALQFGAQLTFTLTNIKLSDCQQD